MNVRFSLAAMLSVAVISFGLMAGCSQQQQADGDHQGQAANAGDHPDVVDPHDVPLTEEQKQQLRDETAKFADAVSKITMFRNSVREETKEGLPENPFAAHQALDRVDLVVQWLPKVAQDSDIPKEHWETITVAANELREAFDKVHQNIDNKVDPDFGSVEKQMATKIAELEAIVP